MRKGKKISAFLLALILTLGIFASCKKSEEDLIKTETTIEWWVSPAFADDGETPFIQELATSFCDIHPKATIKITVLPAGEEQAYLEQANKENKLPDLYFGPLGSVENLGAKYSNLSSLVTEETILPEKFKTLGDLSGNGELSFYPIVAQPYLMAFNKTMLEQYNALEDLPTEGDRQWTMEEYTQVMASLREKLPSDKDVGIFPYGAEEGDIATKAFVLNAYGVGSTDQLNSETGIQSLAALQELMQNNLLATDEITLAEHNAQPNYLVNGFDTPTSQALSSFLAGDSAQTLVYSLGTDLMTGNKKEDFEVVFMPYPSSGTPNLPYELLGMVAFDQGDENKTLANTLLIDYVANNETWRQKVCGYAGGISTNDAYNDFLTGEYAYLRETLPFLGEYRAYGYEDTNEKMAWMLLLRNVTFFGKDPAESITAYETAKTTDFIPTAGEEENASAA